MMKLKRFKTGMFVFALAGGLSTAALPSLAQEAVETEEPGTESVEQELTLPEEDFQDSQQDAIEGLGETDDTTGQGIGDPAAIESAQESALQAQEAADLATQQAEEALTRAEAAEAAAIAAEQAVNERLDEIESNSDWGWLGLLGLLGLFGLAGVNRSKRIEDTTIHHRVPPSDTTIHRIPKEPLDEETPPTRTL